MTTQLLSLSEVSPSKDSVLIYGHFSTIHAGHIRYIRYARGLGKQLYIALIGDTSGVSPSAYPFKQNERAESLSLLNLADFIILLENDDLSPAIQNLSPSIVLLGNELEGSLNLRNSLEILASQGGVVRYHAGDVHYASTDLLNASESDLRTQRIQQFRTACKRQSLNALKLVESMKAWKDSHLIVLGDTIVDQYAACEALGMSAEAPVVVVRELAKKNFIGAAAVVASHISALGAKCDLISVVGDDENADIVHRELHSKGIGDYLVCDSSRPTTFKKRYVVENQKLFRVSQLEDHNLNSDIESQVISRLEQLAPSANGIVVSDFVYGVITPKVIDAVEDLSRRYNLMLFGDLQCSSQVGSITSFQNFSLLCPNERELRLALQDKDSGLESLSQRLLEITKAKRLLTKLAAEGFIAYDRDSKSQIFSQPFPALSVNPLDVAGAGDSVLSVMATGLACGQDMMTTAAIACCMASLAVEQMGNTPIGFEDLLNSVIDYCGPDPML